MRPLVAVPMLLSVASAHAADIDLVAAYEGTWSVEITRAETPFSHEGTETTTVRNDCWRSDDAFQVCHQHVDGKSVALLVFACRAGETACVTYPITAQAGAAHRGTVVAEGRTLTYPWDEERSGKVVHFRVVNVIAHDRIEYRREYSDDALHWHAMEAGHETRSR